MIKIKILLFLFFLSQPLFAYEEHVQVNLNLIVENSEKISVAWDHYVEINWDRFGAEKHLFLLYLKTPENYLIEGQKPIKSAQFN